MQTSYPTKMEVALEGQISGIGPRSIKGYAAESEVAPGMAVIQGTKDAQCKLPAETGGKLLGVVTHTHARETDAVTLKDMVNVMRQGEVWARPEQAVTPGDPVYVRFTAHGDGEVPGRLRKDDDKVSTVATADLLAGAKWGSTAGANELALLILNLP